jgi:pyridoxamine 5'-phosphate oxidase family protein
MNRRTPNVDTFTPTELDYLTSQPLGRIATAQPDGTLQVSPVGFRYNPNLGTIDVSGYNMERSKKFRNVADNGRVAFVVDDLASVRPWRPRCLEIRGRAETVTDGPAGPIIRIHPERVISFGIDETDVAAHSLTVNARNVG